MKNKFMAAILLLSTVVLLASCATHRKYGCPMAQQVKAKNINI